VTPPSTAAARARPRLARETPVPAVPRRVSGPARPTRAGRTLRGAAAVAAAPATRIPGVALPRPRTVPRRARRTPGIGLGRVLGALSALPDARLLDRLIRGRLWIGLVAFALIGIVAMQLMLLKLNTGIGHAIEHEQLLQRQNASFEIALSGESAPDLVEQQAQQLGMTLAAPGAIHFLGGGGSSLTAADVTALSTPVSPSSTSSSGAAGSSPASTGASPGVSAAASAPGTTATDPSAPPSGSGPAAAPATSAASLPSAGGAATGSTAGASGATPSAATGASTGAADQTSAPVAPTTSAGATGAPSLAAGTGTAASGGAAGAAGGPATTTSGGVGATGG
jgi:hypothetical protein